MVGDGATKRDLIANTKHLSNVVHHAPVDFAELSDLLCSADVHILFQKNNVIDTVMPSKILGMMASAKPSIVTGNLASETAKLFEESHGGFFFDGEDLSGVTKQIDAFITSPIKAQDAGKNARKYIIEHFSKENILANALKEMKALVK